MSLYLDKNIVLKNSNIDSVLFKLQFGVNYSDVYEHLNELVNESLLTKQDIEKTYKIINIILNYLKDENDHNYILIEKLLEILIKNKIHPIGNPV